jgi:HAE1 family hydrophobic/amphiphilic exporter-1
VQNLDAARSPEARFVVDRARTVDLGLSPAQVAAVLRTALSGTKVGSYKPDAASTDIDITLRLDPAARSNFDALLRLPLGYRNGQPVTLAQVTTMQRGDAPAIVKRADRQRGLSVTSNVTGRASADVTNDVEKAIQSQVTFPPGYSFMFAGGAEEQRQSFSDMFGALALSIGLIYMLLVALFQSWLHPLAIMFSLPVATVGAFGGLFLTHTTLNIVSLLGLILLVGIVTKNAILLVDFTNMLRREQGYSRKEALVAAGRLRLRPILMTTAALVCAMLPLLLGTGAGSEMRAPIAAVVIGGNISSTLLTLILVPVVYTFLDGGSQRVSRLLRRLLGSESEEDAAEGLVLEPGPAAPAAPRPVPQPRPAPQPQRGASAPASPRPASQTQSGAATSFQK